MIREIAEPREINPAAQYAWEFRVTGSDRTGHICVSVVEGFPYIHDLKHWGDDKTAVAQLFQRARSKVRDLGYEHYHTNHDLDTETATIKTLINHGAKPYQLILRGRA